MEELQDPFCVYKCYCALKLHFRFGSNYDYTANNGSIKVTRSSFERRKDRHFFSYIASKLQEDDLVPYLVAQFIENPSLYIADVIFEKNIANEYYHSFIGRHATIVDNFKFDVHNITKSGQSWKRILIAKSGQPIILKMLQQGKITPETYVILDWIFDFFRYLDKSDDWLQRYNFKYQKYRPFIGLSQKNIVALSKLIPKNC